MHQHDLALGEPATELEREVRRVVVEDQRRALREVQGIGEREGQEVGGDGDRGEAAKRAERRHPVTGP